MENSRGNEDLIQTLNHFIEEVEGDMAEISSFIDDNIENQSLAQDSDVDFYIDRTEQLTMEWDDMKWHLYNLRRTKELLIEL